MNNNKELSRQEIDERVAVLKRFKILLADQREKFRQYLTVLEAQAKSIDDENIDALMQHTELEKEIIEDISTIQKVIDPMEQMYKYVHSSTEETETVEIKQDLNKLQSLVLRQNEKNREKLRTHMAGLRKQINSIKTPFNKNSSVFSDTTDSASMIDIQA